MKTTKVQRQFGVSTSLTKQNWHGCNVGMFRSEEKEERGEKEGVMGREAEVNQAKAEAVERGVATEVEEKGDLL